MSTPPESKTTTNVVIDVGNEEEGTMIEAERTSRPSRDVKPGSSGSPAHGIRPINPFAGENQHQRRPSKIDRILNGETRTNEGTASNLTQPNVPVAVAALVVTEKDPSAAAPNDSNTADSSNRRSCLSTFDTCHIVLMFIVGIAVGIGLFCGIYFGLRRNPPQALSPVEEILIVTPNPSPDILIPSPLTLKPTPNPSKSKSIMDTTTITTPNPIPAPAQIEVSKPTKKSLKVIGNSHVSTSLEKGRFCLLSVEEWTDVMRGKGLISNGNNIANFNDKSNIKGNSGMVVRAKNMRTNVEHGLLIWSDGREAWCSWNPTDFSTTSDWEVGDEIQILDSPTQTTIDVVNFSALTATGWNITGDAIQFGQCGLVGPFWGELEVEYELAADAGSIGGVWTDSTLPYSVMYEMNGLWFSMDDIYEGISSFGNPIKASKIKLRWPSTDLFSLDGLSSSRSGGGIHAELLLSEHTHKPIMNPTSITYPTLPPVNMLANIQADETESICVSYNSHGQATNGILHDRITGSNCGNVQHLVYNLGSEQTVSELKYVYCALPGFTSGAVNEFALSVASSIGGPYINVLSGSNIPVDNGDKRGQKVSFNFPEASGQFWKFSALSNHGNGAYIWTCELELY